MHQKTALITGASRGIGRAIARQLASEGIHLILTCLNTITELKAFGAELETSFGISCRTCICDMGDFQSVQNLFESIEHLDIVVNNAGISHIGLLQDMTPEEWHHLMATNLDSCFYTSKFAIPLMLKNSSGRILNISSVWGNVGASMETAYSASKGAINSFTKALAKELAPSNIQVNAIACGVIDTDMNKCFSEEDMAILREEIPADRLGTAKEVAEMVMQIINSPAYLTGQIITIDGGWC